MKQNKRCTSEFKAQIVELLVTGRPVQEFGEQLRISASPLTDGVPVPGSRRSGAGERMNCSSRAGEYARLQMVDDSLKGPRSSQDWSPIQHREMIGSIRSASVHSCPKCLPRALR
ncbi:MAG: hypothetical protein JWM59_4681 [Verrucomicrobiales bacterium]|nr:hypothetical protein [Verrucomicrobiales bacterium]